MSGEAVIMRLIKNVEDLLDVFGLVVCDLVEVRNSLRELLGELRPRMDVQTVLEMLPGKLRKEVSISEEGNYITVKPKRFLSSEDFKALAEAIISRLGGEYISTTSKGEGYFRLPKNPNAKLNLKG